MTSSPQQTVLITGTSSGFGRGIATQAAMSGYRVIATMRDPHGKNANASADLQEFARENGLSLEVLSLDVASADQIAKCFDDVGPIDVLVNNAATFMYGPIECFDAEQVDRNFRINTHAPVQLIQAALPGMRKAGDGLIVQISSGAGRLVVPGMGLYGASKAALEYITEAMYYELAPLGIDVAIVQPGMYRTAALGKLEGPKHDSISGSYKHIDQFQAELGSHAESYFATDQGDPFEVVEAVMGLVDMQPGTRPLRTVVGPDVLPVNKANQALVTHAIDFIASLGMSAPPANGDSVHLGASTT